MIDVVLKPGRDRSVRRRHPWVLSGAIAQVVGPEEPGALVRVLAAEGEPLGWGHLSPASVIRVRLAGFGKEAPWGGHWLEAEGPGRSGSARRRPCAAGTAMRCVSSMRKGMVYRD